MELAHTEEFKVAEIDQSVLSMNYVLTLVIICSLTLFIFPKRQLIELIWSGTPNVLGSYNLKALFER